MSSSSASGLSQIATPLYRENVDVDVAVVGAGPGGLAAAVQAARDGATVALIDERDGLGGQIWRNATAADPETAKPWRRKLADAEVTCIWNCSVISGDAVARKLDSVSNEGPTTIHYRQLILATGSRELFLPFPGWTLPGVVGVGALQALIKSGISLTNQRVVIAGSGPLLLPVAALAKRAGARLKAVAEQADLLDLVPFGAQLWKRPGKVRDALRYRAAFAGTRYRTGCWVMQVEWAKPRGDFLTSDAQLADIQGDSQRLRATLTDGRRGWRVDCDVLAASYGLVPAIELGVLLGCAITAEGTLLVDEHQNTTVDGVYAVGELTGIAGADAALLEGRIAGRHAAGKQAKKGWLQSRDQEREFAAVLAAAFAPRKELAERVADDTIVCRCEDVPWSKIDPSTSVRGNKLQSRCGMGACQGRICGPALSHLCQMPENPVPRPPLLPVRIDEWLALHPSEESK